MSRSRRKTPIKGVTAASSEKNDKRHANRALRHRARQALAANPTQEVAPERREVGNAWAMAKEGKHFLKAPSAKDLRK